MKSLVHWYFKALEAIMVLCLAAMCIMVFGNVILRHVFDSGINTSEELSRFMFIWLTFLGAVVAMREGGHLGMDMVVTRLPPRARRIALTLGQAGVVACCVMLLWGLVLQHDINVANIGLVTGISLGIVYSVAYVSAASIGVMALVNMVRLMRGIEPDQPLVSDRS